MPALKPPSSPPASPKGVASVFTCTSVGGGVFGERLVRELKAQGVPAQLHSLISLDDYWKSKGARGLWVYWLRVRMYVLYPLLVAAHMLWRGRSTYIATTNPFFLPCLAAWIAPLRGHRVVNLVYDLYPDALISGGAIRPTSPVARVCALITRSAFRRCFATVFLGERLRQHAEGRYGPCRRAIVIPVGAATMGLTEALSLPRLPVRAVYSGHFGRMHDYRVLHELLRSARWRDPGTPSDLEFSFHCNGPHYNALRERLASDLGRPLDGPGPYLLEVADLRLQLNFGGNLGDEAWRPMMLSHHLALITMTEGSQQVVMPSKTYSALLSGQALLCICPPDSDLADLVQQHQCGWTVPPGPHPRASADQLLQILRHLLSHRSELDLRRQAGLAAAEEHYTYAQVAKAFAQLLAP